MTGVWRVGTNADESLVDFQCSGDPYLDAFRTAIVVDLDLDRRRPAETAKPHLGGCTPFDIYQPDPTSAVCADTVAVVAVDKANPDVGFAATVQVHIHLVSITKTSSGSEPDC